MKLLTTRSVRTALVGGAVVAAVAGLAPVALAAPDDTDRPKITTTGYDFGENWTLGAPRNGGHLEWELSGGVTDVDTSGYLYLTDQHCAKVRLTYFNDVHVEIGTDESPMHCAPGSAKTQWFVSETFSSQFVTHVHVDIVRSSGTVAGSTSATFD